MRFVSLIMRLVSVFLYLFILFAPSREIPEYSKGQLVFRYAVVIFFTVASFCRLKKIRHSKRATVISIAIVTIPFWLVLGRVIRGGTSGADLFTWFALILLLFVLLLLPFAFFLEHRASLVKKSHSL